VTKRIRIELDEPGARVLHAALTAALANEAVGPEQAAAARTILQRLRRRVPDWVSQPEGVTEPDALVDLIYAERRPGRWAHRPSVQAIGRLDDEAFDALAGDLRDRGLLEPVERDQLTLTDDGATLARERWAAISPAPHWRIRAPALPYRGLPVKVEPGDRACPSTGCNGKATWLTTSGRSKTRQALTRDGSVEWTCPQCSRTWLIYLQAHKDDGAPAYRDPVEGDHNRPYWRSSR
jgi:hypothetical protein